MSQVKTAIDWVKTNLDGVIESGILNDRKELFQKLNELIAIDSDERPLVCRSIRHLYEGEYLDNKSVFSILETILLHTSSIDTESVYHAIQLLNHLPVSEANANLPIRERITRIDTGRLANNALESRLNTTTDTSGLVPYVKLIKYVNFRPALPVVESIEKNTLDEELKKEAKETVSQLKCSVRKQWEDTPGDYTSTLTARSEQLKDYLSDESLNEDEHIQALFNATRETPAKDALDPRIEEIEKLIDHRSEKLRLAAAFVLCQILKPEDSLFKRAIKEIANLAMFARSSGLCIESSVILEEIECRHPKTSIYIELEKQKVNEEYVKRFKL